MCTQLRRWLAGAVMIFAGMHAASARADDLPFGGDALRLLSSQADDVIRASDPKRLASGEESGSESQTTYAFYSVEVKDVLKGPQQSGQRLNVAIANSLDVKQADDLSDSLLFLKKLGKQDLPSTNASSLITDLFVVVSGRYGVVKSSMPGREDAIRSYIDQARGDAVGGGGTLNWTQQHLSSADPFLQKSAIVDLFYQRDNSSAIKQLGEALKIDAVLPDNKRTAIKALELTGSADAASQLRQTAEDKSEVTSVRKAAVQAFQNIPGSEATLQNWILRDDQVLSPAAQSAIRVLKEK